MNSKIVRLALSLIVLLLIAIVSVLYFGRRVPALVLPVRVVNWYAMSDGGTHVVTIEDANKRQFQIGIRGDLETPPRDFPVFIERWYPSIPVPIFLGKSSAQEKELMLFLEKWIKSIASNEDLEILDKQQVNQYKQLNQDLLHAYPIYALLKKRN